MTSAALRLYWEKGGSPRQMSAVGGYLLYLTKLLGPLVFSNERTRLRDMCVRQGLRRTPQMSFRSLLNEKQKINCKRGGKHPQQESTAEERGLSASADLDVGASAGQE